MKKGILLCIFAGIVLLGTAAFAQGEMAEIPEGARSYLAAYTGNEVFRDGLVFALPQGETVVYVLSEDGYHLIGVMEDAGQWTSLLHADAITRHESFFLSRHSTAQLQPNGVPYPDDMGFDIHAEDGVVLSYHYNGAYMEICGWTEPEKYNGRVMVQGSTISYYPMNSTLPEASYDAGGMLYTWIYDFSTHPASPREAALLYAALPTQRAKFHAGYTLRDWDSYSSGTETKASYSRLEDGVLYVRREYVTVSDGKINARMVECIPLPLSADFQKRLETEPFEDLISLSGYSSVFYEKNALNTKIVPVEGGVIAADVQESCLILMTENEKNERRVQVIEVSGRGDYFVSVQSPILPQYCYLDIFHADEESMNLGWFNGSIEGYAAFGLTADRIWRLTYFTPNYSDHYRMHYGAVTRDSDDMEEERFVGTFYGSTLDTFSPLNMPADADAWRAAMNRSGFAVVSNPNPADRLNLRKEAKQSAESLGKFYNGTIVRVLSEKGEWAKVQIGASGLTGWMMKKYLAMGTAMDQVKPVFPELVYQDAYAASRPAFTDAQLRKAASVDGSFLVIGVVGTKAYILMDDTGHVFYVPQRYLFEGNG